MTRTLYVAHILIGLPRSHEHNRSSFSVMVSATSRAAAGNLACNFALDCWADEWQYGAGRYVAKVASLKPICQTDDPVLRKTVY